MVYICYEKVEIKAYKIDLTYTLSRKILHTTKYKIIKFFAASAAFVTSLRAFFKYWATHRNAPTNKKWSVYIVCLPGGDVAKTW